MMAILLSITGLVLLLAVAKLVLLDRAVAVPPVSGTRFSLDTVRALGSAPPDELPLSLNLLEIGEATLPRTLVIAGGGWGEHTLAFSSIQVVYSGSTVIIDPLHDRAYQESVYPGTPFNEERYREMQEALRGSSLILATHEHFDHIGGIGQSPYLDEIRGLVRLTQEQLDVLSSDSDAAALFPRASLQTLHPLRYDHYLAVAPGMVLIKAPGHTKGLQMIYIRLRSGEEFLLVNDIAWHMENITTPIGRPLLTNLLMKEDGPALASQLRLLHGLASEGKIHLLVSHDKEQHLRYFAGGLLGDRFTLPSPSRER